MRRREFAMTRPEALDFLAAAETFQLCGEGPVLKTLHGVVVDGWLCFHSSPVGEKTSLLGQRVVASVEDVVARIPSTFLDPERACPATTLFRSVQVHGVLREVLEPALKARALQALMEKLQPAGGHVPITHQDPRYAAAVRGLLVAGLALEEVDGKAKLAQNRNPVDRARVLSGLWTRGAPGDTRAIELVRRANPADPVPAPFEAPSGFRLHAWLEPSRAQEAASLLANEYWNDGVFSREDLAAAHLGSSAWVGATDEAGALVASARAISDGGKYAWVYDVVVAGPARARGLGKAVVRLLVDHPAVRRCRRVLLSTRDAQGLYAPLGFVPRASLPARPYVSSELVLVR
jgi:nitroimidazol reductase NimA-like FMN-containing flavoprotein (pyridoxamine 5'-phosphate oxidase superfamily)/GNAT superfamily N-acetyltransferase